jgi:sulfonate transport system ATP-binding protein
MSTVLAYKPVAEPRTPPIDVSPHPVAVRTAGVSRAFSGNVILDRLDLTIRSGEFVALLGASGSGKTTLLRILAGLDAPDGGEAWVPEARTVVFQEPRLVQSKTVWKNVVIGLSGDRASRARAVAALAEVVLLLDEPFAALDALTRLKMQRLIGDLCQAHGPATLLVTHDVEEAILLADRILVLQEGRIGFDTRVPLPLPRRAGGEAFDALRDRLLAELGVPQSE